MLNKVKSVRGGTIGIDANEANTPVRVGVGQYAFNLLHSLSKIPSNNKYFIFLKSPPLSDMPPQSENWHYVVFGPSKMWTRFALPLKLLYFRPKLDLFYSPSHYSPRPAFIPTIPTIHDIGYLNSLDQFNKKDIYQLVNWTKDSLFQANKIVAVSQFTKNELIKTYKIPPQKIFVCPNGVGQPPVLNTSDFSDIKNKFNLHTPYFLSVGTLKPNKNYPFLISSFAQFLKTSNSDFSLVIAGKKGWIYDEIFKTVIKEKLQSKVIFTDFISENEKWHLYQNAMALVIPSLYEGFGIPAIESQKIETPVIASDIPPLKEVLADSCIYIDPTDQKTLVNAFNQIQNITVKTKLIKAGLVQSAKYTWENSAAKLVDVFNSVRL